MGKDLLNEISLKKDKLLEIKEKLKEKFIGIDNVIDKIIDNISLWYLMPDIQFKPLIISLWGITGVGKTDLVRTLVDLLDYTDKFIEIQMDMKNDYTKNIENYLESSGVDNNEPSILLLDEIQRYRTVDEHGNMIDNKYFNDIWMLLSDGKFQINSKRKAEIFEFLMEEMYWNDRNDDSSEKENANVDDEKEKKKKYKYKTSYWNANRMKKILNSDLTVEDIMSMSPEEKIKLLNKSLKYTNINKGKSYDKLLIFISGNLDEAFTMAKSVEDSDSDADIIHEISKRVSIIDIKNALRMKFKPEQIARFGNNHIIYPCLDKKSYKKIITINSDKILDKIYSEKGIKIELSDKIYDIIYSNGVFPTQGVRPVISTIFNILGSNLPFFIYEAMINNIKHIKIEYDSVNSKLYSFINNVKIKKDIILDIDVIKNNKSKDEKMLVLVHELGHALVYTKLFKTPPKQININSTGFSEGFVVNHNSIDNLEIINNKIAIYLSGMVAEEIIFGVNKRSIGSQADIDVATVLAGNSIRRFGMYDTLSKIMKKNTNIIAEYNYDIDKSNDKIEEILKDGKKLSYSILNSNLPLFKELLKFTISNNGIKINEFVEIYRKFDNDLNEKELNEKIISNYDEALNQFLSN